MISLSNSTNFCLAGEEVYTLMSNRDMDLLYHLMDLIKNFDQKLLNTNYMQDSVLLLILFQGKPYPINQC